MRRVVDTNVAIIANGGQENASEGCHQAALKFLKQLLVSGKIIVDFEGAIEAEYRRHLNPSRQRGVGDQFY